MKVTVAGRTYRLPPKLAFEMTDLRCKAARSEMRSYEVLGYRAPRAGEHFLSGAIVKAYRANADMKSSYLVVRPL